MSSVSAGDTASGDIVQTMTLRGRSAAQRHWSETPVRARLQMLRSVRHLLASHSERLVEALSGNPARTAADSLAAEVLPLLGACKFLEEQAPAVLASRKAQGGRPFWLAGVESSVERVALGTVLIIGPSNYPLFLPGVQTLQALAAGNAVIWKPGRGGEQVARVFAEALREAGLPEDLLIVTNESVDAGLSALRAGVDKVFFTGSAEAGRAVLTLAAQSATPAVAELSGCDAVFVLPGADPALVVDALAFGMRLNGSATCMAPRRLMLIGSGHEDLLKRLQQRFAQMGPVPLATATWHLLRDLVEDAASAGANIVGDLRSASVAPVLVLGALAEMRLAQSDVFAPVLSVLHFPDQETALTADALCPYGLTAAIFGPEREALALANRLTVGTVLVNDLIVSTADPRVPFGGRKASGFGVTRGAEGLLEMTAPRTRLIRRSQDRRHFEATGPKHQQLFSGVVLATHTKGWKARLSGWKLIVHAVRAMRPSKADTLRSKA